MIVSAGAFLSTSGILLRSMQQADGWQIIFFRSITFFFFILTVLFFRYGKDTLKAYKHIGIPGLSASILLGVGTILYIFAMLNTTVANVVFIIGASPLITALLAWIFLKERVGFAGLACVVVAMLGIGLMFLDGLVSGGLLGNILALVMVVTFAFYLLVVRRHKEVDMVPATGLSGAFTFVVAAVMAGDLHISAHDLLICIALGSVQFGLGFLLITIGARYIPAAEVALFSLSESILNPIWVWIGVNEVPGVYTLAGSAVVLIAVIVYSLIAIRIERRQT